MKRLLTVLAAVLVLILPTGSRAYAAPEVPWTYAPCFHPYFSNVAWDWTGHALVLSGGATQCGPTVPDAGFRLATYLPGQAYGSAPGHNVRLFPSTAEGLHRPFGAVAVPTAPGEYGVCALGAGDQRLVCVKVIIRAGPAGYFTWLDRDDPLVARPVQTTPFQGVYIPPLDPTRPIPPGNCGTCF